MWFKYGEFNSLNIHHVDVISLSNPLTVDYIVKTDTELNIRGMYNYTYDTSDGLLRGEQRQINACICIHRNTLEEDANVYRRRVRSIIAQFRNKNLQDLVVSSDDTMIYKAIPVIKASEIEEGVYKTIVPITFLCNLYGEERGADGVKLGDQVRTDTPITITGRYPFSRSCIIGQLYQIPYTGTVEVLPKIVLTVKSTSSYIDVIIGKKCSYSDNSVRIDKVASGDRIVIDCQAQSIVINGVANTDRVTLRTGQFPYIEQDVSMQLLGSSAEVTLRYHNLYE